MMALTAITLHSFLCPGTVKSFFRNLREKGLFLFSWMILFSSPAAWEKIVKRPTALSLPVVITQRRRGRGLIIAVCATARSFSSSITNLHLDGAKWGKTFALDTRKEDNDTFFFVRNLQRRWIGQTSCFSTTNLSVCVRHYWRLGYSFI